MSKKVFKMALSLFLSLGMILSSLTVTYAMNNDFEIIKSRLKEFMISQDTFDDGAKVETCYVSMASDYLDLIQDDGSFKDVDYTMTGSAANGGAWEPYLALDRLQAIAIAYHVVDNELYLKPEVIDKLNLAIKHWTTANHGKEPTNSNWWEVQIGIQLRFSRIALMMDGVAGISDETMNTMLYKLLEKTPVKYGTGQNNLWFDQNYVYYAIISENGTKYQASLKDRKMIDLKELVTNYLSYCLVVQEDDNTAEALQVDNSFYMHGRQFYSNGYGLSMFRDMSYWLYMFNDTIFAFDQEMVDLMADYMLEGTSWTIRGDIMELYLGYRPYDSEIGYSNYASAYILPLKRMMEVDKKRVDEYQSILDSITHENSCNGKKGNYYMWRSTYAAHMRDNYGVNIKMDSNQVIGGEWRGSWTGQEDGGQLIYWSSSGASSVVVDGDEYTSIYPTYDWAHVPGTTTPARIVQDYSNSGRFTNGTEHTIGVSNGQYGATAYVMNKKGTKATKGYFFFDNEFVALGTGITSNESVNIHTTLNQCAASDVYVDEKNVVNGSQNQIYSDTKWLYNDKVGYVFLDETDVYISVATQKDNPSLWDEAAKEATPDTFKAYIDHGLKPESGSYAYIVVPDTSVNQVSQYATNIPITVVANNEKVQAVRHDGLKQTQINFYEAGTLEYKPGQTITVNQPCSLIIDETKDVRMISLAFNDTKANQTVSVTLNDGSYETVTTFVSAGLPYAGQTMTLKEGSANLYQSSSSHDIDKAFDQDLTTYWQSEGQIDEYVSFFTESNKHLSTLKIVWGDNFANEYDIYGSDNGKKYELLTSITNGDGGTDIIELNGIYPYIKIIFKNNNSEHLQIKEITWDASESLALNKEVEVSSTSSNDPGNTKEKAVDGNLGTRWSSLRNEDDNWIIVDLGQYAKIDAITLQWEAACSTDYDIQISNDKNNWITIEDGKKTSDEYFDEYNYQSPVYGRYIKVYSHKSATKYGISIYELSVYGNYVKEDIAANKNAFSSTINNLNLPTNAFDHKDNTAWISSQGGQQWIYVELKGIYSILEMSIDWGNDYATNYEIQISDDAQNWTTIKEITNGQGGYEEILDLGNQQAKYVRLKLNQSSGSSYQIIQLTIYGNLLLADNMNNIALNKSTTASSTYNNIYTSNRAVDGSFENNGGNNQSRWVSNRNSNDEWIQIDLGDLYELTGVKLYWEGNGAKKYVIQVSQNGEDWQNVYSEDNGQPGIAYIEFEKAIRGRYVKMQGIEPASRYGYSLWEFEVYGQLAQETKPPESKINIALNKESIASSQYTDSRDGNKTYESSLAFDGSVATVNGKQSRWVSLRTKENPEAKNEWIYVDLGANYDISKVVLNWEGAGAKEYKIQISNDASQWKDISHITDGNGGIDEFEYDNTTGRYIKMQGIEPGGQYGYSLWEFEVYGEVIFESIGPNENLALNKDSEASYEYIDTKNGDKQYYSSLAFDGSTGIVDGKQSRWVSQRDNATDQWIYVDLGGVYNINKVILNWEGAGAKEYKVQISNDASQWEDISHITDGNGGIDELTFEPVLARYVRMYGMVPASKYGFSLWEFEVYNTTDLQLLLDVYNQYKDLDTSLYTPTSVNQYIDALNHLVEIGNSDTTTKDDILKAIDRLEESVANLTKLADKTLLKETIALANQSMDETKYTPNSISKVAIALQQAQVVLTNDDATDDEVNEVIELLNDAINGLIEKANKDNLIAIYNEFWQLNEKQYTQDSYAKVEALVPQIEAIIDDENSLQEAVDQMYQQMRQAIDGLVIKPVIEEKPSDSNNEVTEETKPDFDNEAIVEPEIIPNKDQIQTGDETSLLPLLSLLIISITGYYLIKKKSI